MSSLKELVWVENNYAGILTHTAKSPLHDYTIRYDDLEQAYLVDYYERMTNEHGSEFFRSADEAKTWAQSTHYPSKMQPFVIDDSAARIEQWFKKAKPEPTNKDIYTQIGCHYEEVSEMDVAIMDADDEQGDNELLAKWYKGLSPEIADYEVSGINQIELLDSLCDQIVTAIGVGYMMGFDMQGALNEVIRSNNSKFENGKPIFNEQGKIMKGKDYNEPDLTPFLGERDD